MASGRVPKTKRIFFITFSVLQKKHHYCQWQIPVEPKEYLHTFYLFFHASVP